MNNYTIEDRLKDIKFENNLEFTDALFILQDFITNENIIDYQVQSILDDYSEKIMTLTDCNGYTKESLYILLYSSIMIYYDLVNIEIKNKIKLNSFIRMMAKCNNNDDFPKDFLTKIYNNIYDKIKELNIINNELHDKKITEDRKKTSCAI
jgi:Sec7-like guanine-nucleotide exchange factor